MMMQRIQMKQIRRYVWLILVAVMFWRCGSATDPTPETTVTVAPDSEIATRVAIEQAVAATLTAEVTLLESTAIPSPTATLAAEPSQGDTLPTPTDAAVSQAETVEATCRVVAQALNLRTGPGVIYDTIFSVPLDTELRPIAFTNAGFPGEWLQGEMPSNNNQIIWFSAGPQFVACTIDVTTLPAATIPPTPTPTVTNTPQPDPPTPTPTPEPFTIPPPGGGGNEEIAGVLIFPDFRPGQLNSDDLVFRDRLNFRVAPYDINTGRAEDGAGIDRVEITITDSEGGEHYQEENNRPYCAFDSNAPTCDAWVFADHNYSWPGGDPIINGPHDVFILITPRQGEQANWEFKFEIEGSPRGGGYGYDNDNSADSGELVAELAQIGPNEIDTTIDEALVFQVVAYNPDVGNNDGAGIDSVDLRILYNGQVVYERTEQNAKYCAFSGGDPDCQVWNFADHYDEWPSGQPIERGNHTLWARVNADSGQQMEREWTITIR